MHSICISWRRHHHRLQFDIDRPYGDHQIVTAPDRFYLGILRPDGLRHGYHGVHQRKHRDPALCPRQPSGPIPRPGSDALTISDLTEQFIQAQISWEEALSIVQTKKIVYAPDATMQAVLSDRYGRTLLIEPGIGSRVDTGTYSLMANASLLSPESTRPWLLPGDNRYEKAAQLLAKQGRRFSVSDAFAILRAVRQEGLWATRSPLSFPPSNGRFSMQRIPISIPSKPISSRQCERKEPLCTQRNCYPAQETGRRST